MSLFCLSLSLSLAPSLGDLVCLITDANDIDLFSADATIASQATGAMSWAFISALQQNPQQSYVQLLNSIRDVLETKYTQKPQLSCSHPLGKLLFSFI